MEVRRYQVPQMRVAYASYDGPLDRVGRIFHRIQGWVLRQGGQTEPLIGVYREDFQPVDDAFRPHDASHGHAEAWIEFYGDPDPAIDEQFPDEVPVLLKDVPAVEVAAVRYTGSPLQVLRLQDRFRAFLEEQGFALADETRHLYHVMDPDDMEHWELEVQVPIRAAGPSKTV